MNDDHSKKTDYYPSNTILTILFIVAVFIMALTETQDPDAWLHLSLGRIIWETGWMPEREMFTYPNADMPFSYTSWLFGVIYYLTYKALNVYGIILLKAATISLAFFIMLKDSLRPCKNYPVAVVVLSLGVLISMPRFVERPDTFVMVFLSLSIYCLNAYLYEKKKYIYFLPLIHLLWANTHSSIHLISVLFLSFIVGGLLHRSVFKNVSTVEISMSQIKTVSVIFLLSAASTLATPNFLEQYIYAPSILTTDWNRQEISELLPPEGKELIPLLVSVSLIFSSFILNRKKFSLFHLLLVVPFTVLPFTAVRFQFLIAIVGCPIVIRNISEFLENRGWSSLLNKRISLAMAALWIVLMGSLTVAKVEPFGPRNREFGFDFDYYSMPKGAVEYMDKKGIFGRVFNSYTFGQYIIWKSYPKRTVYIDGRGSLSKDLLERYSAYRSISPVIEELRESYGFESILVNYTFYTPGELERRTYLNYTFPHPEWALVYWDDVSLLYLKRGGKYGSIAAEDEYKYINPDAPLNLILPKAGNAEDYFKELKRNIRETGSERARLLLGILYNSVGLHEEAVITLRDVYYTRRESIRRIAYSISGDSYRKLGDLDKGLAYFRKSLELKENAHTVFNIGLIYLAKNEIRGALENFQRALEMNPDMPEAYPPLIETYKAVGMHEEAESARKKYEDISSKSVALRHFREGVKAYSANDYATAIEELKKSLEINPYAPAAHTNLGYVYLDTGQTEKSIEHFTLALRNDPRHANAYFGLGLVYMKKDDAVNARKYFEQYVELEPSGFFSRRARKLLEVLPGNH